jgi:hypothetical protein
MEKKRPSGRFQPLRSVAFKISRLDSDLSESERHRRMLVIRTNDLTELPPLDGAAWLHFVE